MIIDWTLLFRPVYSSFSFIQSDRAEKKRNWQATQRWIALVSIDLYELSPPKHEKRNENKLPTRLNKVFVSNFQEGYHCVQRKSGVTMTEALWV